MRMVTFRDLVELVVLVAAPILALSQYIGFSWVKKLRPVRKTNCIIYVLALQDLETYRQHFRSTST